MTSKEILLRLLHRAFIEIRIASRDGETHVGEHLSNLLHSVPIAMISADPDEVLKMLIQRAEILGLSSWITTALGDFSDNAKGKMGRGSSA